MPETERYLIRLGETAKGRAVGNLVTHCFRRSSIILADFRSFEPLPIYSLSPSTITYEVSMTPPRSYYSLPNSTLHTHRALCETMMERHLALTVFKWGLQGMLFLRIDLHLG